MKTLIKLSKLLIPLFPVMACAVIFGVAGFICAIGIPVFGSMAMFRRFPVQYLILVGLLRGIFHYGEQYCNHFIAFTVLARIRQIVFKKLRQLGPARLESKEKGNLIAIITSDIELLEVFYAHTVSPVFIAIIVCAVICIFLFKLNPVLCFAALFFYIFVGAAIPLMGRKKVISAGCEYRKQFAGMNAFLLDCLRGIEQSILYGNGKNKLNQIKEKSIQLAESQKKMSEAEGHKVSLTGLSVSLGGISMVFAAIYLYGKNLIDFQTAVISVITMFSSFGPVIALANLGSGLSSTIASGKRVLELLEEKTVVEPVTNGKNVEFHGGKAEKITFSYPGHYEEKILSDISVEFPENSITGIQGKSGSGKSTLLKLFMHFWEAEKGNILISDTDVKTIDSECLKSMESYVTQETVLFHDTIENNIRIAKLDAAKAEIVEACKKAQLHDFIVSLPEGYNTKMAELGDNFSGGERQRIGLARAFLHQGKFLILDEPTSNLDSWNEEQIMNSINEECKGKTVVIVSHRDSTFKHADKIYRLQSDRKS